MFNVVVIKSCNEIKAMFNIDHVDVQLPTLILEKWFLSRVLDPFSMKVFFCSVFWGRTLANWAVTYCRILLGARMRRGSSDERWVHI